MGTRTWIFIGAGLGVALILGAFVSPFASSAPDGLDKFSEDHRFAEKAEGREVWTRAPLRDYKVAGVEREGVSTGLAGALGTLVVFAAAFGVGLLIRRRKRRPAEIANP